MGKIVGKNKMTRKIKIIKTLKFQIHRKTTKKKLDYLNNLVTKLSSTTKMFLGLIGNRKINSFSDFKKYKKEFKETTGLGSAHLQQCFKTAFDTWKSHSKSNRRSSLPKFSNKKIPVFQDKRTFKFIQWNEGKLSKFWIRITTLQLRKRITLPLEYGKYHVKELENAEIKAVAFIKRNEKFFAYVVIKKLIPQIQPQKILAIDLGVRRVATAVLLSPSFKFTSKDIFFFRDGKMLSLIYKAEQYFLKLHRLKKLKALKRIRHLRRTYKEGYDNIISKKIAELAKAEKAIVVVGYPKYCRSTHKKGDMDQTLRKVVHNWSYARFIKMLKYKCGERGIPCILIKEAWTSKTCHRCGSKHTRRPNQGTFVCLSCGLKYNADLNAAINIAIKASPLVAMGRCGPAKINYEKVGKTLEVKSGSSAAHNQTK